MRILKPYLKVFVAAAVSVLPAAGVWAQISPPPGPTTPTLDFLESAQAYTEVGAKYLEEGATMMEQAQGGLNKNLQVLKELPGKIKIDQSMLQKKKGEPNIAISRQDEFGADEQSEEAIAAKFEKLFLIYPFDIINKYPNDKEAIRKAYENEGRRFGDDAIIEMYLVVRNLEERMEALQKEFAELSACYVQSDTSSGSALCQGASDDGSSQAIWGNYAKMNIIYDQMLQITEELYAIRAQYEVAQAMRKGLTPLEANMQDEASGSAPSADKPDDKSADASDIMHYRHVVSGAFAQVLPSKNAKMKVNMQEALKAAAQQGSKESVRGPGNPTARNAQVLKNGNIIKQEISQKIAVEKQDVAPDVTPGLRKMSLRGRMQEITEKARLNADGVQTVTGTAEGLASPAVISRSDAVESVRGPQNRLTDKVQLQPVGNGASVAVQSVSNPSKNVVINTAVVAVDKLEQKQEDGVTTEDGREIGRFDIVKAKPTKIFTPLTGTEESFKELAMSANAYDQVTLAKNLHNLKQQMPGMRESFVETRKMKTLHEKAIEKLKESEDCIIKYLGKYYENPRHVWLGSGCHYSGTKVICGTNRAMSAENLQSLKSGDIACPNDSGQICSSFVVNEYGKRGGFSGWLVSAYKTAKAEKIMEINQDDVSPATLSADGAAELEDFNNPEKMAKKGLAELEISDSPWATPSKSLEVEDQSREADLIGWQIGAEGAKALGKDMASDNPKWGKVTNPYPVWNDEKYFYDQYLEEKYRNMKLFIQGLDMSGVVIDAAQQISDSLTGALLQGLSIVQVKAYNTRVLGDTAGLLENAEPDPEETPVEEVKKENDLKLKQVMAAFERQMTALDADKKGVYDVLDKHSLELKDQKTAFNEAFAENKTADVMIESQHKALGIAKKRKSLKDVITGLTAKAENQIVESKKAGKEALKKQDTLDAEIEFSREKIDDAKGDLEGVEHKIAQAKSVYALSASKAEDQNFNQINEALYAMESGAVAPRLGQNPLFNQALDSAKGGNALQKRILQAVVGVADNYADKAKQQMIEKIDEAYEKIEEMGDERYNPANHEQLVKIHQDLINDLKNMPALEAVETTLPIGAVSAAVSSLYKEFLMSAVCGDGLCMTVDEEYFVGLPPKTRDFTAPNKIAVYYTAPLREVVHFDLVDYHNLTKADGGETTRGEFLNYGQDMPQIWERILNSNGFVERDVDIGKLLRNNQNAADMLLRGGTYPCKVARRMIDIKNGEFYAYMAEGDAPVCKGIKSAVMFANGNVNLIFNSGDRALAVFGKEKPDYKPSELSQLLKYNQGVAVGDKVVEIANFFEDLEGDTDADSYGVKGKLFEDAMLKRNQFGDYLTFVEMESVYQNSIDKLDVSLDEAREKINESLRKFGHDLGDDFDLADDETYDKIMKLLDAHKNKVLNAAVGEVGQISAKNDYIKERKDKLHNLIKAMQMDSDELLQISDNTAADNAFAEQIKRKQTDGKVMGKFKEDAQSAYEKQLENFQEPYCPVY